MIARKFDVLGISLKWYGSLRFFGIHPHFEAELSQHPVA